jgi:hypothetical protein
MGDQKRKRVMRSMGEGESIIYKKINASLSDIGFQE